MKIPAKFKIGKLTYDVVLQEEITGYSETEGGFLFGLCDPMEQKIYVATKSPKGNPLSEERMLTTFYHEVTHVFFGEIADQALYADEVIVEAVSKNIMSFIETMEGEAEMPEEVEEIEEEVEKPIKKKNSKK